MVVSFIVFRYVVGIAVVHGKSMYPTLSEGNLVLFYRNKDVETGDIVVIQCDPLREIIIKRVIGLPGDTIEIKNGITYINGEKTEETNIITDPDDQMNRQVVPEGMIFVMGDNRANSVDSRMRNVGMLPIQKVIGISFRH